MTAGQTDGDRARTLDRLAVSRETRDRLDLFVATLTKWQRTINLVAPSTLPELWTRHVLDSAQVRLRFPERRIWLDLGSGAGFPGLITAILLADQPEARVHLVESDQRKASFLAEAARLTGAPATVIPRRIETVMVAPPDGIQMISARALAPLGQLLLWCEPLLKKGVDACFLKGRDLEAELTEAAKSWRLDVERIDSITDANARLLHVRRAERRHPLEA